MKKCPACNRTYSDETLSFCLEDGSLLSASLNLREEQETVITPNKIKPAPTEYFPAATHDYSEKPTIVSAKNTNLTSPQTPKTLNAVNLVILLIIWNFFIVTAIYTGSLIPLLAGILITLIYMALQPLIKRIIK